ncbi:hypothetical protein SPI_06210 [Niveomyces insectorum RCEF 264]|uniref:Transcription factor hoxa13 n=1 Tax=Niveomyces insectorum RCEF 264 TaxID=1081102 RepID=A0A167RWF6_9HYPO|nr:hypothetical protein SPI_06210 [Niveomyces insectorum RCEF 264]
MACMAKRHVPVELARGGYTAGVSTCRDKGGDRTLLPLRIRRRPVAAVPEDTIGRQDVVRRLEAAKLCLAHLSASTGHTPCPAPETRHAPPRRRIRNIPPSRFAQLQIIFTPRVRTALSNRPSDATDAPPTSTMAGANGYSKTARSSGSPQIKREDKPRGSIQTIPTRPKARPRRFIGRVVSTIARILTWYSIYVLLFRCPANLEACDESTPRICTPYFRAKQIVAPYATTCYDAYAAPYVQVVKPYYDTVDRAVLAPTRTYAVKYGAPQVARAQAVGRTQWDNNVQPQLAKARAAAAQQYDRILGPYVNQLAAAVGPYYEAARDSALQTHRDVILPTYAFVAPYATRGYEAVSAFTTHTVIPSAVWTWNKVAVFVDGIVWPRLRVLYVDTVEPQLEKIGQRLGRYSDFQAEPAASQKTIHSSAPSSFTKPAQPTTSSKTSSSASSSTTSSATTSAVTSSTSTAAAPTQPPPPGITEAAKLKRPEPIKQDKPQTEESEQRRIARETVAEDLKAWQEKYAKAADEGAAEVDKRVEEISKRMIRRNARTTGKSLLNELDKTVEANLVQLRQDLVAIVGAVRAGAATPAEGEDQIVAAVRRAGVEIKEQARAVRSWREAYSKELQDTVSRSAENHFKILGSIRDLALQKIGMKWAWMEGVTYKDWAKYHQLKSRFDEWENDFEQLIVTHPGLAEAENAGQAIEDEGMQIAQAAAKELARLKQVGGWKLAAGDDSDNFDSDATKAAADAAIAAKAAEAAGSAQVAGDELNDDIDVSEAIDEAEAETTSTETVVLSKIAEASTAPDDASVADDNATEATPSAPIVEASATDDVVSPDASATSEEATPSVSSVPADDAPDAVPTETASSAEASAETDADETTAEETASADASVETAADAVPIGTLAPEDVPIILGETTVIETPSAAAETELPEAAESEEAVHLPVDEVVSAGDVPLDVASSLDASSTVVKEAVGKETTPADSHLEEAAEVDAEVEEL